jgi:hypothetical protein
MLSVQNVTRWPEKLSRHFRIRILPNLTKKIARNLNLNFEKLNQLYSELTIAMKNICFQIYICSKIVLAFNFLIQKSAAMFAILRLKLNNTLKFVYVIFLDCKLFHTVYFLQVIEIFWQISLFILKLLRIIYLVFSFYFVNWIIFICLKNFAKFSRAKFCKIQWWKILQKVAKLSKILVWFP